MSAQEITRKLDKGGFGPRMGKRREEVVGPLYLDEAHSARFIGMNQSKMLGKTESWVIHPPGDPGAAIAQFILFKSGGRWAVWTGNITRASIRKLGEQLAGVRNQAGG